MLSKLRYTMADFLWNPLANKRQSTITRTNMTAIQDIQDIQDTVKTLDQQLEKAQATWLKQMDDFKDPLGFVRLPVTPMLSDRHLEHCQVVPHREAILRKMKPGCVAAEVGVQTGRFSRSILDICQPTHLHLIDLDLRRFGIRDQFQTEIQRGSVHLHEGDSSSILKTFPDRYFDFIYIDGDHSYEGVKRDLDVAKSKIHEEGCLIFNDYTYWSPVECMRYGVIQAVNELCLEEDWEIIYFSLAVYMYCDVVVRRRR